jgi:uncharacterized protein YbjQ (UPF0145 family)
LADKTLVLVTTTGSVEGSRIVKYIDIVSGETIVGANFIRDFLANITEVIGGRSGAYERSLRDAKKTAIQEMVEEAKKLGANAVVGVSIDYDSVGLGEDRGSMLMVTASGTAVVIE